MHQLHGEHERLETAIGALCPEDVDRLMQEDAERLVEEVEESEQSGDITHNQANRLIRKLRLITGAALLALTGVICSDESDTDETRFGGRTERNVAMKKDDLIRSASYDIMESNEYRNGSDDFIWSQWLMRNIDDTYKHGHREPIQSFIWQGKNMPEYDYRRKVWRLLYTGLDGTLNKVETKYLRSTWSENDPWNTEPREQHVPILSQPAE